LGQEEREAQPLATAPSFVATVTLVVLAVLPTVTSAVVPVKEEIRKERVREKPDESSTMILMPEISDLEPCWGYSA
jgi:hypothetical protein